MKTTFLAFFFCFMQMLRAQYHDNFNQCSQGPDSFWQGMRSSFICGGGVLRSTHQVANSWFYISGKSNSGAGEQQWNLYFRFEFNPSSLNFADFILMADSQNLLNMRRALFVRMGGSSDEISLFRLSNGQEQKIADGADGLLNTGSPAYEVSVLLKGDSLFLQYRKDSSGAFSKPLSVAMSAADTVLLYGGLRIRQSSSSFFGKHVFDRMYCGEIIKDTTAPVCDSIRVADKQQIRLYFSEPCDTSLAYTRHYLLDERLYPDSAQVSEDRKAVILYFHKPQPVNTWFTLMVSGIRDLAGNISESRLHRLIRYEADTPVFRDLLITELMADPEPVQGLDKREYVEIRNVSGKFIQTGACTLSDGLTTVKLPDIVLHPDSCLLLYQIPSLNNSEDHLYLKNGGGALVHELQYSDTWYRDVNKAGGGFSLEMIDYAETCRISENWTASRDERGGTPGALNSVNGTLPAELVPPCIKRICTEADSLLYLYSEEPAIIADSLMVFCGDRQFALAPPAFDSQQMRFRFRFPFNPHPDSLYRIRIPPLKDCPGNICPAAESRLIWPVKGTKGSVLFSEILFDPHPGGKDFIELYNPGPHALELSGLMLSESAGDTFPLKLYRITDSFSLFLPGQFLLLSEDTLNICWNYTCAHSGRRLQMSQLPAMPDAAGHLFLLNSEAQILDQVSYSAGMHSPVLQDAEGVSLERVSYSVPAQVKGNWQSAASTAGFATPGAKNSQSADRPVSNRVFELESGTFSPDQDGFEDVLVLHCRMPAAGYLADVWVYTLDGLPLRQLCNNCSPGTEGMLVWDGSNQQGVVQAPGVYVLIAVYGKPGEKPERVKLSVVLAARF